MGAAMPLVEARGLSWHDRRGRCVVEGIDLDVAPGERCALTGPNGAGKTTLLRLLAGRLRPTRGTLRIGGRPLEALPDAQRARTVATLTQDESIDGRFEVREYVALGRLPHRRTAAPGDHDAAVEHAMRACRIEALGGRAVASLSGGERQRVRLARAIAQQPSVLLLDEPTNHLDLAARIELLDLVATLGLATVAAVHDLALLPRFADRVVVLERGRTVRSGAPASVLEPGLVRSVFGLDVYHATHPSSGARTLAFDRTAA